MPYITQSNRDRLDAAVAELTSALQQIAAADDHPTSYVGAVNYAITKTILGAFPDRENYGSINAAVGVLTCVREEYYRRVAAPYENQKTFDADDVY